MMTERDWHNKLNSMLISCGDCQILVKNKIRQKWQIVCSFSDEETSYHEHAYQAVNEWNEPRKDKSE